MTYSKKSKKNADNSQNVNFKVVMTLFWKLLETFWHNLQIFESRTFWWKSSSRSFNQVLVSKFRSRLSLLSSQWLVRYTEFFKIVEAINVMQRQAWNQILQLLPNKRSSCRHHIANMLPNKENKLQCTNVSNVKHVAFCFVFFNGQTVRPMNADKITILAQHPKSLGTAVL